MEFSKTIFQAWKVRENNIGHGKSWKMVVKSWDFYNCLQKLSTVMWNQWWIMHSVADSSLELNCQAADLLSPSVTECRWQPATFADSEPIGCLCKCVTFSQALDHRHEQEVKVIWQKAPHGGPIPRLGVTPGGRKLYHWIPGVGFPISVP